MFKGELFFIIGELGSFFALKQLDMDPYEVATQ